jgi:hypothetical protein
MIDLTRANGRGFRLSRRPKANPAPAAIALGLVASMASTIGVAYGTPTGPHGIFPDTLRTTDWAQSAGKRYRFRTIDNPADPTFNALTGINDAGIISGYDGSGGYTISPPYGASNYSEENFPHAARTQVTGIDNLGNTAGSFVDKKGRTRGFVEWHHVFRSYSEQPLYGLNDAGNTVWGSEGSTVYTLNQATGNVTPVYECAFPAEFVGGSGIDDAGDVVGWGFDITGLFGWAIVGGKCYAVYGTGSDVSGAVASGISNRNEIAGTYFVGRSQVPHGFVLTNLLTKPTYETVDDPNGIGTTGISGVNDKGELVGTYVDQAGNTNGFLATPR